MMVAPESTVPVGATIAVTPTSITGAERTVTVPDRVSLAGMTSPARAVEQRVACVPRCTAFQVVKDTSAESPGARLITFRELE
jgi:hypothetical protein